MGRHEIRLRRNRMTSGRIEGYKDYRDLMNKHSRADRLRKAYRLFLIVLGGIALLFFAYLFFVSPEDKTESKTSEIGVLNNQETFYINSIAGDTLNTKNGSIIYIQKNAFTKNGKLVIGKVKVLYQEYRNPIDIALANINMSYNGGYLESAGMFSFHALQGKDTLAPSTDSSSFIQVHYRSKMYDSNFQQYKLDDNKDWELVGDQKVLVPFKILADYDNYPELEYFKDVEWVTGSEEGISNKLFTEYFFKYSWTYTYIDKDSVPNQYLLYLNFLRKKKPQYQYETDEAVSHEIAIKPINYLDQIDSLFNEYRKLIKSNVLNSKAYDSIAYNNGVTEIDSNLVVMSMFTLTDFNTWNIDRPLSFNDFVSIKPKFFDEQGKALYPKHVNAISQNLNTVFRFKETLKLKPNEPFTIFFLNNTRELFFCNTSITENTKTLEFKKVELSSTNNVTIAEAMGYEFKETPMQIDSTFVFESPELLENLSTERPEMYKKKNVIWSIKEIEK